MNHAELANRLNGCDYPLESDNLLEELQANSLVVLHPYSDDNMEIHGAIDDEFGCWGGGTAYLTRSGLVPGMAEDGEIEEPPDNVDDLLKMADLIKSSIKIKVADTDINDNPIWCYEMPENFPHSTFELHDEDDKVMAICVVFSIHDMPEMVEA